MTIWPPDPAKLARPVYRSLARSLVSAIEAGEVRQGDRLPTQRELAERLRLSVQTVSRAYDELARDGLIAGRVGRGTFVSASDAETATPWHRIDAGEEVVDCSMLMPVIGSIHSERTSATLARLSRDVPGDVLFSFRPRATLSRHTEAALPWLKRCGVETTRAQVIPTNGNTGAMTVALMSAAKPGDLVVSEDLTHHTLKPLCRYLGLDLRGLESDGEGLVPDAFAKACREADIRVAYLVPNGLNPRPGIMSETRRRDVVEIARRHDVAIVENDAWGPLQGVFAPPLMELAPERTFYFTGLTKCLMPGLRYGWLVVPDTMVSAAANRHLVTNWMATALMAEIGTRWIEDGTADDLLGWQQRALERRNRLAAEMLDGLRWSGTGKGMHVWLDLPDLWNADAFVMHARLEGVAVAAGSAFAVSDSSPSAGIRICLGAPREDALKRGLAAIARLARNRPEPALLTI